MVNRCIPDTHSLRNRLLVFAFLVLAALSCGIAEHRQTEQQVVEIDYN